MPSVLVTVPAAAAGVDVVVVTSLKETLDRVSRELAELHPVVGVSLSIGPICSSSEVN